MAFCIRDVAKVVAGVAANETIGHWWLGTVGTRFLPIDFGWFSFTREANWFAMGAWPLVLGVCVWVGWLRREAERVAAAAGSRPGTA